METILTIPQYIEELKKKTKNSTYQKNITYKLLPLVLKKDKKENFKIEKFFKGQKMENMLKKLSVFNEKEQIKIIAEHKKGLVEMSEAIENLDIEFLKKRFVGYYYDDDILTAEKVNQDIEIFQQAFARNPEKYSNIKELIPLNFAKNVLLVENATVICHTLSNVMTICALDILHEILIAKLASYKFNIKILVSLYQDDSEINEILSFYYYYSESFKNKTDYFVLNEKKWTFGGWDVQKEYFKLETSKNFKKENFFKHITIGEFRKINSKNISIGLKVELFKKIFKNK